MVLCPTKDIDTDFSGTDRDWVKSYMEQRFGETQVCSVGTYTKLQLKSAMSDLYRQKDNDYDYIKTITKKIGGNDDESDGRTLTDLFKLAVKDNDLKGFIKNYPDIINDMSVILQQPKATSVHACAMMIFPKERDMYSWSPVRYDKKKKMVVSEMEGEELDEMGFLKFDALGIKQLDKWQDIINLVKERRGEDIDIYTLPLEDKEVYKYFKKGWNSDVFQFGSKGLSEFSKQLKPRTIHDLIAGVALYRPGAMENHFHTAYCKRKDGKEDVEYMWGTDHISASTYGLVIYQEQVMEICQKIGGFTGDESNSTLKALGKKKVEKLKPWKEKFVANAVLKGCPKDEADGLWNMMLEFAKYSFNLSHSAAYAITGYVCQYLKVHYPLEFWTVAFKYADPKKDIPRYLSEINKIGGVKVLPPDVNVSTESMGTDFENNSIHFGLVDIKFTGEGAAKQIVEERNRNGLFQSLEDFIDRHIYKGSKVTKRNVEGLILSGAFDALESVNLPSERHALLVQYYAIADVKVDEKNKYREKKKDWWWTLVQKEFSGIAFFDYPSLSKSHMGRKKFADDLITGVKMHSEVKCITGGFVTEVDFRKSKRGEYAKIYLETNYEFIPVTIWSDSLKGIRDEVANSKGGLMFISGTAKYDTYQRRNVLHSNEDTKIKVLK